MDSAIKLLHQIKQYQFLQVFTIYLRYLIGGAFVIAAFGMGKFSNQELLISNPGAPIEQLQPLQQFFRVMSTSGLYWNFIGWSQLIAGALLMTQRLSKLGAIIFFGLILNIFIITLSYDFRGTPVIIGLMLMATTYLLAWDFDSFQFILRKPSGTFFRPGLKIEDDIFWTIVGVAMLTIIIALAMFQIFFLTQLLVPFAMGFIAFCYYFLFHKRRRQVQVST